MSAGCSTGGLANDCAGWCSMIQVVVIVSKEFRRWETCAFNPVRVRVSLPQPCCLHGYEYGLGRHPATRCAASQLPNNETTDGSDACRMESAVTSILHRRCLDTTLLQTWASSRLSERHHSALHTCTNLHRMVGKNQDRGWRHAGEAHYRRGTNIVCPLMQAKYPPTCSHEDPFVR